MTFQGAFTQINCSSPLYVGGVPDYEQTKTMAGVKKPFTGIIQKVFKHTHSLSNPRTHAHTANLFLENVVIWRKTIILNWFVLCDNQMY